MQTDISRRRLLQWSALAAGVVATSGALAGCGISEDPPEVDRLRLATGPAGAVYREMGAALADLWNEAWGREVIQLVATEAAVENLQLLNEERVELAFINVDVLASEDTGHRALLRIFDSVLHLMVPVDSAIETLADLVGARVAAGLAGSGTRFISDRLLRAAELTVATASDAVSAGVPAVELIDLAQDDAAAGLAAGEVDAILSLTAMPTPALTDLFADDGAYRFVDLTEPLQALQAAHPDEYLSVTISGAVYPGVEAVTAPGVPTLIAVGATDRGDDRISRQITDEIARFLTRTVIEGAAELRAVRPEAAQINVRTAVATTPIELHLASAGYFRSIKD